MTLDIFQGERATDHATPRGFMDWLHLHFGWRPDLDAAATVRNTKAPRFFNPHQDGLKQDWFGHVWLNPPYGRAIPEWLEKCVKEAQRCPSEGGIESIWVLVPARVDTKWFHEIVMPYASKVCLIKGRFNFIHRSSVENANAPFPSMLVVFNPLQTDGPSMGRAEITTLEVPPEARGFV